MEEFKIKEEMIGFKCNVTLVLKEKFNQDMVGQNMMTSISKDGNYVMIYGKEDVDEYARMLVSVIEWTEINAHPRAHIDDIYLDYIDEVCPESQTPIVQYYIVKLIDNESIVKFDIENAEYKDYRFDKSEFIVVVDDNEVDTDTGFQFEDIIYSTTEIKDNKNQKNETALLMLKLKTYTLITKEDESDV